MSNVATTTDAILQTLVTGDISRLSDNDKLGYIQRLCESLGLNPLTRPFQLIKFQGKEIVYATRDCTDQLRRIHKVSITIKSRELLGGVYVVTAGAVLPDGRCDESTGAISTDNLKGESLANAYLKCETKSKRRVTLSICGLGFMDETEVETIKDAVRVPLKTLADINEERAKELQQALRDDMTKAEMTALSKKIVAKIKAEPIPSIKEAFRIPEGISTEIQSSGDYVAKCGREGGPVMGHKLKDISESDLMGFMQWLRRGGKDGASQSYVAEPDVQEFIFHVEEYLNDKKRRKLEGGE